MIYGAVGDDDDDNIIVPFDHSRNKKNYLYSHKIMTLKPPSYAV